MKVDNTANKEAARNTGMVVGAVAGAAIGYQVGSNHGLNAAAGGVAGAAAGNVAASGVKDKVIVEGVSLTYKENNHVYTSTQVGKQCRFRTGVAVVITTQTNETRIQPNATCPTEGNK